MPQSCLDFPHIWNHRFVSALIKLCITGCTATYLENQIKSFDRLMFYAWVTVLSARWIWLCYSTWFDSFCFLAVVFIGFTCISLMKLWTALSTSRYLPFCSLVKPLVEALPNYRNMSIPPVTNTCFMYWKFKPFIFICILCCKHNVFLQVPCDNRTISKTM